MFMSSKPQQHWVDRFAARCAVLYPESWALQSRDLMQAQKYEYATTRGLTNATCQEIDRALDIWKSKNKFPPKPAELVEYLELARTEFKREEDIEKAKKALPKPNEYLSSKNIEAINKKVDEYRKKNPHATWMDITKAAMQGAFKCG